MISFQRYTVVETKEEFETKYDANRKRFCGEAFLRNPETLSFPLYLYYCPPFDAHFCGNYTVTTKEKMEEALKEHIAKLQKTLDNLP